VSIGKKKTASCRFQCWGNSFSTILIAVMDIPMGTLRKLVLTSDLMTYLSSEHAERFYFFRIGLVHRCVRRGRFMAVYLARGSVLSLSFVEPNKRERPKKPDEPAPRHAPRNVGLQDPVSSRNPLLTLILFPL